MLRNPVEREKESSDACPILQSPLSPPLPLFSIHSVLSDTALNISLVHAVIVSNAPALSLP